MYYFRAIPDFKLITRIFADCFTEGSQQVNHLRNFENSLFLFSKSRDAMNMLIRKSYEDLGRKVKLCVPNLFCWEIIAQFGSNEVDISFYELNQDLRICSFPKHSIDVFLYVDLFGITIDITEVRKFCRGEGIKLFIDQAHCLNQTREPEVNEYVFLSLYKHYPVYDGAALVVNKEDKIEISNYVAQLQFKNHSNIKILTWILKSAYISMSSRMKYVANDYISTTETSKMYETDLYKMSRMSISIVNREYSKIDNIRYPYDFYHLIVKILKEKFSIDLINCGYKNSHLFALKFDNSSDAVEVFSVFMKVRLPIITWPEKKYISNIPNTLQRQSMDIIDRMIFLPAFYNNSMSNSRKERVLKQIRDYINGN